MIANVLWFLAGGLITGVLNFFILLIYKKTIKKLNATNTKYLLNEFAQNLPLAIIMHHKDNKTQSSNELFNNWYDENFIPIDEDGSISIDYESQWQAIENQMSKNSLRNFKSNRTQLYEKNYEFEMLLDCTDNQKIMAYGFSIEDTHNTTHVIALNTQTTTKQ
ncbi:MAG: hypothetical protein ACK5LE_02235 [Alphaproteobacteria bacterium]